MIFRTMRPWLAVRSLCEIRSTRDVFYFWNHVKSSAPKIQELGDFDIVDISNSSCPSQVTYDGQSSYVTLLL